MSKKYYIIDFDSTFTQVEALDELARISLREHPEREQIYKKIEDLTNQAMDGKLSFRESLAGRIQLLEANKDHLKQLVKHLKKQVSTSFSRNKNFFSRHADDVLIVSGGFKEFITPVVLPFHIKKENIYANTFVFNEEGKIVGYDEANPLSFEGGKVKLLRELQLQGEIHGIGDGYSDFQLKEFGMIKKFYAFTENIERKSVTEKADHITPSLDEFLYVNNLPSAISYPKNRILCVVIGDVPDIAVKYLKKDGFSVKQVASLEEKHIAAAGIILMGNKASISPEELSRAAKLKVIGYLGNSKKYISHDTCTAMGVVIFDNIRKPESVAKRIAKFINNGDSFKSSNFPNIQLPEVKNGHRFIHIHRNVPGVMAKVNQVFAGHGINIVSQFLMTNECIGYVITDISAEYDKQVLKDLKNTNNTISFRVLY
ncbi:HAD-IB family phosphatase [Chitinophaga niastensis]|uniref:HAD-IB family phosphatase n=1 Tax=Chitinophaga niastensis TaxID=536980 RepID=UPI001FEA8DF9|nr:HAD-IB family phosphatase [Chitinophaga niastensis]